MTPDTSSPECTPILSSIGCPSGSDTCPRQGGVPVSRKRHSCLCQHIDKQRRPFGKAPQQHGRQAFQNRPSSSCSSRVVSNMLLDPRRRRWQQTYSASELQQRLRQPDEGVRMVQVFVLHPGHKQHATAWRAEVLREHYTGLPF